MEPSPDRIGMTNVYMRPVGLDKNRAICLNEYVKETDREEAEKLESSLYYLLGFGAASSILSGILMIVSGEYFKRTILYAGLCSEVLTISLLTGAIIIVNLPALCVYEYGGMSYGGGGQQNSISSVITSFCVIYIVVFKLYEIWFMVAFIMEITKLKKANSKEMKEKEKKARKAEKEFFAKLGEEVDKMNKGELEDDGAQEDEKENEDSKKKNKKGKKIESKKNSEPDEKSMKFDEPSAEIGLKSRKISNANYISNS